jgi:hypothetical protein
LKNPAIQLSTSCNCGKPGGKHKSSCPRNKKQLAAKAKEHKVEHQKASSFANLITYNTSWTAQSGATKAHVDRYYRNHGQLRGHRSDDSSSGRQGVTDADFQKFKKWYEDNYDNYGEPRE